MKFPAKIIGDEIVKTESTSRNRLSIDDMKRIKRSDLREAAQSLIEGKVKHSFADSTHYDILLSDGRRLPPKALFGVAASRVLNIEVLPAHFIGGEGTPCFRILLAAGFQIVPKDYSLSDSNIPDKSN